MADHLGRWLAWQTYLYPASGVQITHVTVWRWTWKRVRALPYEQRRPRKYLWPE